jgi:glutamate--cysteine ligase
LTQKQSRLELLIKSNQQNLLKGGLKGIEKESLRITADNQISQQPHPRRIGSALTHSSITTDYSEALLEFITPPFAEIDDALNYMKVLHKFTYDQIDDELLWATSMPCGISGDKSIPIAQYGNSNIGKMKHIYRQGLGHRYGRAMQVIAGIHYNYSVPEALWPALKELEGSKEPLNEYQNRGYFSMTRNLQHNGWLLLYLFGASPALCKSFLKSHHDNQSIALTELDEYTLYKPHATSLRMSDIGYKNSHQATLNVSYNNVSEYVDCLTQAIEMPWPAYENIGVKVDGEYRQLNDRLLQIENEYYSTVRPKQIAQTGEKPTLALKRRGVRYIEIRSLDLNPYDPVGMSASQLRFVEAFTLYCLLSESPEDSLKIKNSFKFNLSETARRGRKEGLLLDSSNNRRKLTEWALELLEAIQPISELLDSGEKEPLYQLALAQQLERVKEPELTPSAKILAGMQQEEEPFGCYAMRLSQQQKTYFQNFKLDESRKKELETEAMRSLEAQKRLEAEKQLPFDQFLADYFAQQ